MSNRVTAVVLSTFFSLFGCASHPQVNDLRGHAAAASADPFVYTKDGQPISCRQYWDAMEDYYASTQPGMVLVGTEERCASAK